VLLTARANLETPLNKLLRASSSKAISFATVSPQSTLLPAGWLDSTTNIQKGSPMLPAAKLASIVTEIQYAHRVCNQCANQAACTVSGGMTTS